MRKGRLGEAEECAEHLTASKHGGGGIPTLAIWPQSPCFELLPPMKENLNSDFGIH